MNIKLITLLLLFSTAAIAQPATNSKLKVGDKIPDILLTKLLNTNGQAIRLSDYKGKVIVLDLWNTSCSYSVSEFKDLDSLQIVFKNDLKVFRITRDSEEYLKKLFDRSELAAKSKLPLVYSDTTLSKLFPIPTPHQVWIDREGVVRAIARSRDFTANNIKRISSNAEFKLLPMDYFRDFNSGLPLFVQASVAFEDRVREYSFVSKYINGINVKLGHTIDPGSGKITRRAFYNWSPGNLIKFAYGGFGHDNKFGITTDNRRLRYEGNNPEKLFEPMNQDMKSQWIWDNAHCYEVQVTPGNASKLPHIMQEDLKRYFRLDIAEKELEVSGLALTVKDRALLKPSSGGISRSEVNTITKIHTIRNSKTVELVRMLSGMLKTDIIADETNVEYAIDLSLLHSWDWQNIRDQLNKYGFDLVRKSVKVEMLVIRDI